MFVFLVKTNGLILAAYAQTNHAETHARTVTGARVVPVEVLMKLPSTVTDDVGSDDWEEAPTPVQGVATDITVTQASTPRAKAKAKKSTRTR